MEENEQILTVEEIMASDGNLLMLILSKFPFESLAILLTVIGALIAFLSLNKIKSKIPLKGFNYVVFGFGFFFLSQAIPFIVFFLSYLIPSIYDTYDNSLFYFIEFIANILFLTGAVLFLFGAIKMSNHKNAV